ncbi:hypothetical protein MRS44_013486 [Fusarium solani]|uniref:uncharacterized protein n=1 Tax=Fusarium solani TaxID=169388 RepID=UPI0032C49D8D|nr:hypothetical protein MRS44_013486 [Fusarium solani]
MECLTNSDALTRCPKRVRLDAEYVDGLPTWANAHEGNGNDYGNSIGWGCQVFGLPAEPLTQQLRRIWPFALLNLPILLPYCLIKVIRPCSPPAHRASVCVPFHKPLTNLDYVHYNPNQLLELQSLTRSLGEPHRLMSVLVETNPWPLILSQACRDTAVSDAIVSAIGCLAGMYIYDYLADELIREAVCRRYTMAPEYYKELLNGLESSRPGEGEEFVALWVVLSTIHVVQAQQRHGKPGSPSWLEGYKQCKSFLHQTNPGGPFWENVAVQRSHLRDALSVIVGRGLIFSQQLAPLPDADLLDLPEQATEFNWLLFGNERKTSEIHGGCGLLTRLMHSIAQVSYCVSCLMQKPESTVFQMTPKYLLRDLETTRQWSREHKSWEMAKASPQPIEWIRSWPTVLITESGVAEYTFVIFAALAQKAHGADRNPRLPRNHPSVVNQKDDLARCIRIIPTSGPYFTAQAPLLPAFILGLLAIGTDHKKVSQTRFEQVLNTPVRSVSGNVLCTHDDFFEARMLMSLDQSVPLLLQSLKRTWCWIDNGIKTPTLPAVLPEAICERDPWWEKLVAAITESEGGILCVV